MNSYRHSSSRVVDNNEVAIQVPLSAPPKLSGNNSNRNGYSNVSIENPSAGEYNPLSKLNDRIQTIYSKWNTQGAINAANQDVMAEAATALAIHQYASKYPIYIAAGSEFKEAVQAQTCFHEARRADRENRAAYKNAYKEHMAVGVLQQIGYDVKMYIRENKANILATLGLAIALIVLFVQINAKIADINDNRLNPLASRVATVESSAALAQGKVDTVNAQLDSVQATVVRINAQSAAANASILAMNQVVNSFNVSSYITQVNALTNAGIPQLLSTASSAQQLCTEAQKNFTTMQAVVLQASLNQTKNLIQQINNKSAVLLDLSANPNGVTLSSYSLLPFVPVFNTGVAIRCSSGNCVLVGPGVFHLTMEIAVAPNSGPAGAGWDYCWTIQAGTPPCLGVGGHGTLYSGLDSPISAEAFVSLSSNQTLQVYTSLLLTVGSAAHTSVTGGDGSFNRASVVQIV
jgi:hypothetical protein